MSFVFSRFINGYIADLSNNPRKDVLSGLTVAVALVPEAVAFSIIAGVGPLVGLYAAFIVGLITAVFGGRPGMISGATGALAVVMVSLVATHGIEYLFATVVLMGILQIIAGVFKLGRFIRIVPHPVMLGFVNGLAIVIFLAQLKQFGQSEGVGWAQGTVFEGTVIDIAWLPSNELALMLLLVAVTMLIIHFLPKLTTLIPSALAAIIILTIVVVIFGVKTPVVGDTASISGGLPSFHIPAVPLNWETLGIIFPYAIVLAAIGLIESMLTLRLIDEVTETMGSAKHETFALGSANLITGFFGGMGGCAMIGQSMINVNSGGTGRLSGIVASVSLLLIILIAYPLIEVIPIAALIGVMFIVVISTFAWSSFRIIKKIPKADAFVLILVSSVTVWQDLAVAVIVGVIVSALVFAWENAGHVKVKKVSNDPGHTHYLISGPLYFSSTSEFLRGFTPREDEDDVSIDFSQARVCDHSALEAIDSLAEKYQNAGKTLHLLYLSEKCKNLLTKAGDLVEVSVMDDSETFQSHLERTRDNGVS